MSVPLTGNDADILSLVEQDIRRMMHQISEAENSLSEQKEQDTKKIKLLLLSVVEAMDAFDRVFDSIRSKQDKVDRQMKKWIGNFRAIRRTLEKLLKEQEVVPIEILDQSFDPHWHSAEIIADPTKPDGTIVEEVLKGYLWNKQILRKAKVIVVRNEE